MRLLAALILSSTLGAACGGGSVTPLRGVFIDSSVSGIGYSTPTQKGVTNSLGEFKYFEEEQVTFNFVM